MVDEHSSKGPPNVRPRFDATLVCQGPGLSPSPTRYALECPPSSGVLERRRISAKLLRLHQPWCRSIFATNFAFRTLVEWTHNGGNDFGIEQVRPNNTV